MDAMTAIAFDIHDTPLGSVFTLVGDAGIIAMSVMEASAHDTLAGWTEVIGVIPVPSPRDTAQVREFLDGYFAGRDGLALPLDLRLVRGFARDALEAIAEIPYAETASYADIAVAAGSPRAHRAVGSACARTPISLALPVHRVVRADGSIGEYGGRPEHKRYLLDLEARVRAGRDAPASPRA